MAKREVIELLMRYIELLRSEGISVSKAFLYGSYSDETATDQSDIDVLLVSDQFDQADDQLAGKIWRLTLKVSSKIEPFLIGSNKFNRDDSSPIISTVKESGIQII